MPVSESGVAEASENSEPDEVILFEFTPNGAVTGTVQTSVLLPTPDSLGQKTDPQVTSTAMRTFFFTPSVQGSNLVAFLLMIWCLSEINIRDSRNPVLDYTVSGC